MFEIILSEKAINNLRDITRYIAKSSESNAVKYHDELIKHINNLSKEPLIGPPVKLQRLKANGYRHLVVGKHIAYYLVDSTKEQVHVMTILHETMDQKKHLPSYK